MLLISRSISYAITILFSIVPVSRTKPTTPKQDRIDPDLRLPMAQRDPFNGTATLSSLNSTDPPTQAADNTGSDYDQPVQPRAARWIEKQLRALADKHEIRQTMVERLRVLEGFEIVLLCDDSGSMKASVDGTSRTRWDELRSFVKIVIEIGCIFDSNGIDIFFLNREPLLNVHHSTEVDRAFTVPPNGHTPLVRALRRILKLHAARTDHDKKLLIFIATDGEPTDAEGEPNLDEFERVMKNERQSDTTHVMFLLCTDDPTSVDYLRHWDRTMVHVDVTDDFRKERDIIRRKCGAKYPFSHGDYIVKALIGAVDKEIDLIDDLIPENNSGGQ